MKGWKKKCLCILAILLVLLVVYLCSPFLRVSTFVYAYHSDIEDALATHNSVPVIWGVDAYNTWAGEHSMTEFILFVSGLGSETTCYGCYYSYDNVPLAFQNVDAELVQNGHDYWEWAGEGDNQGVTRRILDNWFYFEASF